MKFGSFVLGGLAGAAVVMLMRTRTMTSVRSGMSEMWKHRMNAWKENAIEKGLNVKFGAGMKHAASASSMPEVKQEMSQTAQENSH